MKVCQEFHGWSVCVFEEKKKKKTEIGCSPDYFFSPLRQKMVWEQDFSITSLESTYPLFNSATLREYEKGSILISYITLLQWVLHDGVGSLGGRLLEIMYYE